MSPYAGEGANLAMLDAAQLELAIVAHPGDVETALSAYETAMFSRAQTSAEISAGAGHVLQRRRPTRDRRLFTAMRPADHDADHDLSLSVPPIRRAGRRKVQVPRWRPRHGSQRRL